MNRINVTLVRDLDQKEGKSLTLEELDTLARYNYRIETVTGDVIINYCRSISDMKKSLESLKIEEDATGKVRAVYIQQIEGGENQWH